MMDQVLAHPFSLLAGLVVLLFVLRSTRAVFWSGRDGDSYILPQTWRGTVWLAFAAGVLLVNSLAHFTHGISGEDFPAPFGYLAGPGLGKNIANVVWGFFCLALGLRLLPDADKRTNRWWQISFLGGVLAMGLFLSVVFTK